MQPPMNPPPTPVATSPMPTAGSLASVPMSESAPAGSAPCCTRTRTARARQPMGYGTRGFLSCAGGARGVLHLSTAPEKPKYPEANRGSVRLGRPGHLGLPGACQGHKKPTPPPGLGAISGPGPGLAARDSPERKFGICGEICSVQKYASCLRTTERGGLWPGVGPAAKRQVHAQPLIGETPLRWCRGGWKCRGVEAPPASMSGDGGIPGAMYWHPEPRLDGRSPTEDREDRRGGGLGVWVQVACEEAGGAERRCTGPAGVGGAEEGSRPP
jgi:hypothetical protein